MTASEPLLQEQIGHVRMLTLNRPDAGNALDLQMLTSLTALIRELTIDPGDTRCAVITGAGQRIFCGGGDMKERRMMAPAAARRHRGLMEQLIRDLQECPVPFIAAVNGAAVGAGCELVAAVDFAYAAETARFSLPEVKLGIVPGGGATQTLPRACGPRRAKELILTGKMFSAAEALQWGLVNKLLPPQDLVPAALETARLISANAPMAVRESKKAIGLAMDVDLATGLRFELQAHHRTAVTRDRAEGLLSIAEKRTPIFRGE
ncbi:enoyl-CoA hydratase/isomerase family protein [Mesorhizobium sp. BR1-1-9]|uniref:enoyl-CoA hydratase-related protein n=1 Tax=Mesorhizobium sp. BR1-1-9 TaxID=2876646 RepID=UPI001CD0B39B|nr:enoyl-CoA hydratase-related protein [Mesorhizobium sp. BR1-1-9]MBZ9870423.1 enoyl-CoA hydratase/isomerase family protein [Mesorhizobium sp. BR1-1-9]